MPMPEPTGLEPRRASGGGGKALLGGGPGEGDLRVMLLLMLPSGLTRSGISRGRSCGRLGRIGDDGGVGANGLVDIAVDGLSAESATDVVAVPVLLGCLPCVL